MKKPKYLIEERSSGGHGDFYELEEERFIDVKHAKTGKVIMTFTSEHAADFVGGVWANWRSYGVSKVELAEDGKSLRVHRYDQPDVDIVQLPK